MSEEEQTQETEVVGLVEQEKSGFKAGLDRCIASKPGWEWRALLASYGTFYLFMAAWFAFHLHVMYTMMPGWGVDEVSTYTHNNIQLAEPRNVRFMMNGIACAADKYTADNGLYPDPWAQEEVELTTIKPKKGEREASQQLRILNNFDLRYIQKGNPIAVTCTMTEDSPAGAYFADFKDPWKDKRTHPHFKKGDPDFGPNALHAGRAAGSGSAVAAEESGGPRQFTFTWKSEASAPHIVEYKVKSAETGTVSVECTVDEKEEVRDAYYFYEPHDKEFEFGFDEQDTTSYTVQFQ
jgi:hypothetical protein